MPARPSTSPVHGPPRRGTSLVEVLVAMILLSVAAMSVVSYSLRVSEVRRGSKQRSASLIAAQQVMDSVRSLTYDHMTVGLFQQSITVGDVPLSVTTEVGAGNGTVKPVSVTVRNGKGAVLQRLISAVHDETQ